MEINVVEDLTDAEVRTLRAFADAQAKLYIVDDAEQLELEPLEVA